MTIALLAAAILVACFLFVDLTYSAMRRRRRAFDGSMAEIRAACERATRQNADWN